MLGNFSNCGSTQFFGGKGKIKGRLFSKQLKLMLNVGHNCNPLVDSGLLVCVGVI